jgi:hypothetical protein
MFPPTIFRRTLLHYISELLLVIKPMIAVTGAYRFGAEHGNDIVIESEIEIAGSEPFAFYRKLIKGQLQINEDGGFKEISFRNDNLEIFNAQFISE